MDRSARRVHASAGRGCTNVGPGLVLVAEDAAPAQFVQLSENDEDAVALRARAREPLTRPFRFRLLTVFDDLLCRHDGNKITLLFPTCPCGKSLSPSHVLTD